VPLVVSRPHNLAYLPIPAAVPSCTVAHHPIGFLLGRSLWPSVLETSQRLDSSPQRFKKNRFVCS